MSDSFKFFISMRKELGQKRHNLLAFAKGWEEREERLKDKDMRRKRTKTEGREERDK